MRTETQKTTKVRKKITVSRSE